MLFSQVFGQYDALQSPNTFDAKDNPNYWKNKKPHAGYWQQDVYYKIDVSLDDASEQIKGEVELTYTNNSPDELTELYFHLYQNAFEPNSYSFQKEGRDIDEDLEQHQGTSVSNMSVNSMDVQTEMDNSILKVVLKDPIRPGDKAVIEYAFTTRFGANHGRMKSYNAWGARHFNVVHWYPRISVYDQKFGWTKDQHLGTEFYGDFGAFDVSIDLPAQYVLDGTGFLVNREEVLPQELRKKLDVSNFAGKPWGEQPSVITPVSDERKTWKFHAENVHDFAWTADPTYRIGEAKATLDNGREVTCYALVQEPHAARWQNAAQYAASVIELFSSDFGEYTYHKMIVADARDGMEYPMLTLDGGRDPYYRDLFVHEIGHNWFYGMIGNNETYRASLDEGFTQFLTSWGMEKLEGDTTEYYSSEGLADALFGEAYSTRFEQVYMGYYASAITRQQDPQLNTHSDHFVHDRQYGQVYYKTATMLYNLEYVLGEELFQSAMKNYVEQWKFCHPYFEDFRRSIIQYTGVDLNWFFDQWLTTDETIDYKLKSIKKRGGHHVLTLQRKGMTMPLDIAIEDKEGNVHNYIIPNTDWTKESDAEVLPVWYGWGTFNDEYHVHLNTDYTIKDVTIDPSSRLADVYQLNNSTKSKLSVELNDFQKYSPKHEYLVEFNPILWYNAYDGIKAGLRVKGDYYRQYHRFDFRVWYNTSLAQQQNFFDPAESSMHNPVSYLFKYDHRLRKNLSNVRFGLESSWMAGLVRNEVSLVKTLSNQKTDVGIRVGSLYRMAAQDLNYLHYPFEWNEEQWNNYTDVRLSHNYKYKNGKGKIRSTLRSPLFWSDYSYGFLNLSSVNDNYLGPLNFRTRVFGQFGLGQNWAPESELFVAGANPEQMMKNRWTRAEMFIPESYYGYGSMTANFQTGGGLNLRGYNNYLVPQYNGDSLIRMPYSNSTGLAFNGELEFDDILRIKRDWREFVELKTYLFYDAGVINVNRTNESFAFANLRMDAGLGLTLDIKQWGRMDDADPFQFRVDFPLFLSRPPAGEEFVQFRWLIGFNRAF